MSLLQEAIDVHFTVIKVNKPRQFYMSTVKVFVYLKHPVVLSSVVASVVFQGQPFGIHYIKLLDPDLLVQIARIMLGYAPTEVSNYYSEYHISSGRPAPNL